MGTIGTRISFILEQKNLKKVQFAEKLGIHQSYVTKLVKGQTIPSEALVKLICREFDINEAWLMTGEGEPYRKPDATLFADYAKERRMTEFEAQFVRAWLELPEDVREMLAKHFQERMGSPTRPAQPAPAEPRNVHDWTDAEILAETQRQLDEEKKGTTAQSTGSLSVSGADCA